MKSKPLGKQLLASAAPRAAVGGLLAAGPQLFAELLHGRPGPTRQPALQIRIFAVCEIALGMGTRMAVVANGDVRRWLLALSLIDTGGAGLLPALRRRAISSCDGPGPPSSSHPGVAVGQGPWP